MIGFTDTLRLPMNRCRDCNSTLKKEETVCFTCGAMVPTESTQSMLGQRFAGLLKIAFFASLGLTVISLFTDFTPSFAKCATFSIILLLVKSSAEQMLEKKKS